MGRILSFVVIAGVMFLSVTGCDKIKSLFPHKNSTTTTITEPQPMQVKGTIIAKINNTIMITLEDLNKEVEFYNMNISQSDRFTPEEKTKLKITTRDGKIKYLKDSMVRQRVFYQAALDKRLDQKEEVVGALEKYKILILAEAAVAEVIKDIKATSAEIENTYPAVKDLLKEPEERKVRVIVAATESDAKQLYIQLLQGADFVSLARTSSIHSESAKNGGDLGLIKKGDKGEKYAAFDEVVFSPALTQGSISNIFKGPDGYYIVKIESIKGGTAPSIKEVWDKLDQYITAQKMKERTDKYFSDLEKTMKIDFLESNIK